MKRTTQRPDWQIGRSFSRGMEHIPGLVTEPVLKRWRRLFNPLNPVLLVFVCVFALPDIYAQTNVPSLQPFFTFSAEELKAIAQNGNAKAQNALGFRYLTGQGVAKDPATAAKWYRKSADQGFAPSQTELGTMYSRGEGVDKNYVEAVTWFRKAAEHGETGAYVQLGHHYREGLGVEKDPTEAVKWFRKAAEQGEVYGQTGLARMYQNGEGVAIDYVEAVKWYRKAADQGYGGGQGQLGVMYVMGRGVAQDYVEAYAYLSLAVSNGFSDAGQLREAVGKRLSEEQRSEAQKRIDKLKAEVAIRRGRSP